MCGTQNITGEREQIFVGGLGLNVYIFFSLFLFVLLSALSFTVSYIWASYFFLFMKKTNSFIIWQFFPNHSVGPCAVFAIPFASLRGLARNSVYLAATVLLKVLHFLVAYDEPPILGEKTPKTQFYDGVNNQKW